MSSCPNTGYYNACANRIYFAGRLIYEDAVFHETTEAAAMVHTDRLGSVVRRDEQYRPPAISRYFPYGEEAVTTSQDRTKFATYLRDSASGLDYAQQRYDARTMARFTSPDPHPGSAQLASPQTWNRYSYALNDPANFNDPSGMMVGLWRAIERVFGGIYRNLGSDDGPPLLPDFEPLLSLLQGQMRGEGPRGPAQRPELPTYVRQWWSLSADCRRGLETAMPDTNIRQRAGEDTLARFRVGALTRARAAQDILRSAAAPHGVDWRILAAIGIRETAFRSIVQAGGGAGRGVFQIDTGQNPEVSEAQAMELTWSAGWTARTLAQNYEKLRSDHPNLSPEQLLQATAASWNLGVGGISGNPDTIDVGSPGDNYGRNVIDLMDCFR